MRYFDGIHVFKFSEHTCMPAPYRYILSFRERERHYEGKEFSPSLPDRFSVVISQSLHL